MENRGPENLFLAEPFGCPKAVFYGLSCFSAIMCKRENKKIISKNKNFHFWQVIGLKKSFLAELFECPKGTFLCSIIWCHFFFLVARQQRDKCNSKFSNGVYVQSLRRKGT